MDEVSLGIKHGHEHRLIISNLEEINWIRHQINLNNTQAGGVYKVYQVVGWGRPLDIAEADCRRYVQRHHSNGNEYFHCCVPYDRNKKFDCHQSALSSWNCAWNALGRPEFVVLVRIPVMKEEVKNATDSNNNT